MKKPWAITSVTIEGFKSYKRLDDFQLNPGLNLLIGANGAGKSNFIDFFRLLQQICWGNMGGYIQQMGGAKSLLFRGLSATLAIQAQIKTTCDELNVRLIPDVYNNLFLQEALPFSGSSLAVGSVWSACFYHLHNTAPFTPIRTNSSINSGRVVSPDQSVAAPVLLPGGENLAAILYQTKHNHLDAYNKIIQAIRQVYPIFDDFIFETTSNNHNPDTLVTLNWKQKGSPYLFGAWQLSDGTLRFIGLITALLQPNRPRVLFVDEPELGLHPHAIRVLAGALNEAAYDSQLIVGTQSIELLNSMTPKEVVTVNMHHGETVLKRLSQDDLGHWLKDFTLGDLWWKQVIQAGPNYV
ncbi:MAG: AAA family ATPase [Candidatus Adiutrix sp.]